MNRFERLFRPSSMVDEKEWEGFRADAIVVLVCAILLTVFLFLLGVPESIKPSGENVCEAKNLGQPVFCDGAECGCTGDMPNYRG